MEGTTYIADLLKVLKKYLWLIILLGLIGGVSGRMLTSEAQPPTYEASSLVLIKPLMNETNTIINQTDETVRFLNTAQTLINTNAILGPVKKELKLKDNVKTLAGKVRVSNENGSHLIKITVSDNNPDKATRIANGVADVFKREIGSFLDVEKVNIVVKAQKGQENEFTNVPRTNANTVMGTIIGLILGVFLSLVLFYFLKPSNKA
ncbi:YveK family protein [Neobacillus niacini]|uniref:YveK family protein n=1 Tax=Neobacillus niacini TaxID=86668 RepID=UPI0021CB6167|nr:Wzz/FepE/Etk N-terminal domain-containing protein [Neobacillus niacini]MCM3763505.1 Wzz/FepE/Etk N-terminal domain-containing protein [Neobacillus niacini]